MTDKEKRLKTMEELYKETVIENGIEIKKYHPMYAVGYKPQCGMTKSNLMVQQLNIKGRAPALKHDYNQ